MPVCKIKNVVGGKMVGSSTSKNSSSSLQKWRLNCNDSGML